MGFVDWWWVKMWINPKEKIVASAFVGADFVLSRERFYHRGAMFFSSVVERRTGDEDFDRSVFIASDDPRVAAAFRKSPQARAIAKDMLVNGAPAIRCEKSSLHMNLPRDGIDGLKYPEKLDKHFDEMHARWAKPLDLLGQALAEADPGLGAYKPEPSAEIARRARRFFSMLSLAYCAFIAWAGYHAMIEPMDWLAAPPPFLGYVLMWALQSVLVLGFVVAISRHSSRLPLAMGWGLIFSIVAVAPASPLVLRVVNAKLPSFSPVVEYQASVTVVQFKMGWGRSRVESPQLIVGPPPEAVLRQAEIQRPDFKWHAPFHADRSWKFRMGPYSRARVSIQKGFLGLPLVRSIEPCSHADPCR